MGNVLYILLGAALVLAGVLSGALADRIRGVRLARAPLQREVADARAPRQSEGNAARAARTRQPLAVVLSPEEAMARDVQLALETSGFSKAEAQAATRGVAATDKHSLENWIRAAFRKLNKVAA